MHTGHSPSGGFIRKAVPFFLPGSSGWRDSLVSGHITSFFQASTFKSLLCVQMVFCVYQVSFCLPLLRTVVITFGAHPDNPWASLLAQIVKNLLAVQETWVQSLGWEDPRGREWLPTLVFLSGESIDRGSWRATVHGVAKSQTQLRDSHTTHTDFLFTEPSLHFTSCMKL